MTIRVGVLGAGFIARYHRAALRGCDVDHEIVAVFDPDSARASAFAEKTGGVACETTAEVLDRVDAVFITTWTSEHAPLVRAAAERQLAIFCEKPLGLDGHEAAELVDVVESAGVTNQVGLVLRALGPMRLIPHVLADERAGAPLAISFRDDQFIPTQGHYESDWRADPARAGRGTILEHSIHDVDLLLWWLGPVRAVSATTRNHHGIPGIEDVGAVRFDFESGAVATLVSIWHDILERPSQRLIEVFTERAHIRLENESAGPVHVRFTGEDERSLAGDELVSELRAVDDRPRFPASEFLAAVRDGVPVQPDFRTALAAHRVVDAIYESAAAAGRPVAPHPA